MTDPKRPTSAANAAAGAAADIPSRDGISAEEARELLDVRGPALYELLLRAGKTRAHYLGDQSIAFCNIVNAQSGRCPENCAFCAQSSHYKTDSPVYPLMALEEILDRARKAKEMGARAFSIVTSGSRLKAGPLLDVCCAAFEWIAANLGLECCASLGRADAEVLGCLKQAGLIRYHHNLETARSHFPKICSSYSYDESLATLRAAHEAGLEICCGGIFGMGESPAQRVELAETLRGLRVQSVPLNLLNPRPGTPLGDRPLLDPMEALKTIAVFRLMLPDKDILIAGGREVVLRDQQAMLFLAGVNGLMVGDYLTTANRDWQLDRRMVEDQGFSLRPPNRTVRGSGEPPAGPAMS
ncbi:MAG: biotin synthase BioB [Myxococcales bacterium]|nr:MAG: biotin synthase BioB [Myxococcales bacterium]